MIGIGGVATRKPSAAEHVQRIAAILGPMIVASLLTHANVNAAFLAFAVAALIDAATVYFLTIETRGKTLEEIARSIGKDRRPWKSSKGDAET